MATLKQGNIEWILNPTTPVVGYLDWFDHRYKIIKVVAGGETKYWLDQGLRLTGSVSDIVDHDPFLSSFVRNGPEFHQGSTYYKLGDKFEAIFFSTGFFEHLIPPECRIPTRKEARKNLGGVDTLALSQLLNLADSEGNDIYNDESIEDERKHRFWVSYFEDANILHYKGPISGAVERVRVAYATSEYDDGLDIDIDNKTSFFRLTSGAMFQVGDWDYPDSPDRKRTWYRYNYLDHIAQYWGAPDHVIYPGGIYVGSQNGMSLEDHLKEFEDWVRDNPAGTEFWNPDTYWMFTRRAITVTQMMHYGMMGFFRSLGNSNRSVYESNIFLRFLKACSLMIDVTYLIRLFQLFIPGTNRDYGGSAAPTSSWWWLARKLGLTNQRYYNDTPWYVYLGFAAARAFFAGWQYQKPRWAEFRLLVTAPPPDTITEDPINEYPDPIFFSSGY